MMHETRSRLVERLHERRLAELPGERREHLNLLTYALADGASLPMASKIGKKQPAPPKPRNPVAQVVKTPLYRTRKVPSKKLYRRTNRKWDSY